MMPLDWLSLSVFIPIIKMNFIGCFLSMAHFGALSQGGRNKKRILDILQLFLWTGNETRVYRARRGRVKAGSVTRCRTAFTRLPAYSGGLENQPGSPVPQRDIYVFG